MGSGRLVLMGLLVSASGGLAGAAGAPAIRIDPGEAAVSAGETFFIDLRFENPDGVPIAGFQCFVEFDGDVLEALGAEAPDGAAFPEDRGGVGFLAVGPWPDSGFVRYPAWSDGAGAEAVAALGLAVPGFSEPATGPEGVLARFYFRALAPVPSTAFRMDGLAYAVETALVAGDGTLFPTTLAGAEIRISAILRPAAPACASQGMGVALEWTNPQAYDEIQVRRDGVEIARLTGDRAAYLDEDVAPGERYAYELVGVAGADASPPARCEVSFASPVFVRGDVDANGTVNISDPVRLLGHLFSGKAIPCEDAADFDDSGSLDLADAVGILNYLFSQGRAPSPPFPDPGIDVTPDELACPGA